MDFLKAFRLVYSNKLTIEEAVKRLDPRNTMAVGSQSLVKPEVLEEAKEIIEAIPKLMEINELKWPPD